MTAPGVAFYVSGHGFGHASRQIEIINALGAASPGTPILIRTSAALPAHTGAHRHRNRDHPTVGAR